MVILMPDIRMQGEAGMHFFRLLIGSCVYHTSTTRAQLDSPVIFLILWMRVSKILHDHAHAYSAVHPADA